MKTFKAKIGDKLKILKDGNSGGTSYKIDEIVTCRDYTDSFVHIKTSENKTCCLNEDEYEVYIEPKQQFEIDKWYEFKSNKDSINNQIGKCVELYDNIKFEPWIINSNELHRGSGSFSSRIIILIKELKEEDECIQKFFTKPIKQKLDDKGRVLKKFKIGSWYSNPRYIDKMDYGRIKSCISSDGCGYSYNAIYFDAVIKNGILTENVNISQANTDFDVEMKEVNWDDINPNKKEDLLERAKRDYPIGTVVKCLVHGTPEHVLGLDFIKVEDEIRMSSYPDRQVLYRNGKWAEIISKPAFNTEKIEERIKELEDIQYVKFINDGCFGWTKNKIYKVTEPMIDDDGAKRLNYPQYGSNYFISSSQFEFDVQESAKYYEKVPIIEEKEWIPQSGEWAKCIGKSNICDKGTSSGWEKDKVFKIRNYDCGILWPDPSGNGIWNCKGHVRKALQNEIPNKGLYKQIKDNASIFNYGTPGELGIFSSNKFLNISNYDSVMAAGMALHVSDVDPIPKADIDVIDVFTKKKSLPMDTTVFRPQKAQELTKINKQKSITI